MKKADNFDASKWLIENKITTQSRLNEEIKKGTYRLVGPQTGKYKYKYYLYLFLGYDYPEGKNPNWTLLSSQDGESFSRETIFNDKFTPLLSSLPSFQQDSDNITVSLDDIKNIFFQIFRNMF